MIKVNNNVFVVKFTDSASIFLFFFEKKSHILFIQHDQKSGIADSYQQENRWFETLP